MNLDTHTHYTQIYRVTHEIREHISFFFYQNESKVINEEKKYIEDY